MRLKKNKNQLIISVIVGIAIAAASYQVIIKLKIENDSLKKAAQASQSIPIKKNYYIVSNVDIKKGDIMVADNLTTKQFPIEIEGAITDVSEIVGLSASKDIKADSPIIRGYFKVLNSEITRYEPKRGFRAVSVMLEAFPPYVVPGAHVDVYFSKSAVFAQDVKVLNIVDILESKQKFVMLEIKDKDVATFVDAVNSESAVIIQRNKNEKTGYKFGTALAKLPQMPVETKSSTPQGLMEISDISQAPQEDISPKTLEADKKELPKIKDDILVVESKVKDEEEIEFISGDKKIIVGAPR